MQNLGSVTIKATQSVVTHVSEAPWKFRKIPEAPVILSRINLFAAVALTTSVLLASALSPAFAQDDVRKRGDIACKSSSNRLCSKFVSQGDMAILACLQQNKAKLAGSCRKFLTEIGQLY